MTVGEIFHLGNMLCCLDRLHRPTADLRCSIKARKDMTMKRFALQSPLRGEGKIVRQAGGMHRYGHVILSVEPVQGLLSLTWEVLPAQIPEEFRDAVFRGIKAQFARGARFDRYTSDGLRIRIVDGSSHQTDSNEGSFEIASSLALLSALEALDSSST